MNPREKEVSPVAVGSGASGSAARCPKCNGVGYFVRTRYFDTEAADVWECQSPQCTSFGLLWHVSRPYSDEENMARATQMTDAELVTHLRTMARIFDGQLAKWVLGVAAERIERHSSQNTADDARTKAVASGRLFEDPDGKSTNKNNPQNSAE